MRLPRLAAVSSVVLCSLTAMVSAADESWVVYPGDADKPGAGKHIVLVSGDEEYRSEEALPQLGKILSRHHGFKCTVLFAVNPETGEIDPNVNDNIPGLEALKTADLMIIATRFRNLPDEQMQHIVDYVESGRPVIGMRTATHAFNIKGDSRFAKYSFRSGEEGYKGGFGKQVLGETWVAHHGAHGKEGTRGIAAPGAEGHPILKGIGEGEIWGPTDVYRVKLPLPGDSKPLVLGQVIDDLGPDGDPVEGKKNDPMMPVAWTKTYEAANGKRARVFATTMGAATDLVSEGTRRMLVNASYWALEMEDRIPKKANVEIVGEYEPSPFRFGGFKRGVKPSDHALE